MLCGKKKPVENCCGIVLTVAYVVQHCVVVVYRIKSPDKLRLAMLYALRYEDTGNLRAVKARLLDSGLTAEKVDLLDALLQYAGMHHSRHTHNRSQQCPVV